MNSRTVKFRNQIRLITVFALFVSTLYIPNLQPIANATVAGTSECASDISYLAGATTNYVDGQCVVVFSGAPNAGGNRANSWTAPLGVTKVRVLLVGGGGSGGKGGIGSNEAGGGGAGGLILAETSTVPGTTYEFTIGSGGSGANYGSSGNSSAAFGFEAFGGGKGGGSNGSTISLPGSGGSGGGGAHDKVTGGSRNQVFGRGFDGGTPITNSAGAGGGGAVGKGKTTSQVVTPYAAYVGGDGGEGFCTAISGTSTCYAGGGGGTGSWSNDTQIYGAGGSSVGGAGNGSAGLDNTGSGGGGRTGSEAGNAGNGGSGVLIIRWTPSGYTNSLKMYAKTDSGATSSTTFSSAGKFYSSCSSSEDVFPYPGDSFASRNWGADSDGGGPIGCGGDGFTLYVTGWVKVPASTVRFYTKGDDGTKLQIDGVTKVEYTSDQGPVIQPVNNSNNEVTGLVPDTWHRIDAWLHENGGSAYLELMWSTDGGTTKTAIPATSLTYQFPSTIKSISTSSSFAVRESSTVTMELDTTTVKVYNDAGTSLLAQTGSFQIVDSGTVSTMCSAFTPNAAGRGTCIWRPENLGTRPIVFAYNSADNLGVNNTQLFLSSTSSAQISSTRQSLLVESMYSSSDTDTAISLTSDTQYAALSDTTSSIFDLNTGTGLTIQAWVNPSNCSGSTERPVVHKLNAYSLYCKSGTWWYKFAGASTAWSGVDTGVPVRLNSWQNVTIAKLTNSNNVGFTLDGKTETITARLSADGAGSGAMAVNNNDFEIGAQSGVGKFLGQIDEVKVFNIYRYDFQIPGDISNYLSPSTSGLVAYYDMNESSTGFIHNRVTGSLISQDLKVYGSPNFPSIAETSYSAGVTTVIFKRSYLTAGSGWKMPVAKSNVSVVLVGGGGGGGGGYQGGGGGAGGMIESTTSLAATFYPIKIGLGGAGRKTACDALPKNGESTTAFNLTAIGGGSGGVEYQCGGLSDNSNGDYLSVAPNAGGSGGGGNWSSLAGAAGTTGQGNPGGTSINLENSGGYYTTTRYGGAGGGGAGAAGSAPVGTKIASPTLVAKGGNGGAGKYSEILGSYVAGGGGGSIRNADSTSYKGLGGNGGGGDSGWATGLNASDGAPNTGGGGGASSGIYGGDGMSSPEKFYILGQSGDGGSGIVALRWSEKSKQAPIYIGQYTAFTGISTYPINVYGGSGTGTLTRSMIDSGTAQCVLQSGFFVQANKVGQCSVSATKAEDANYYAETATATIYWIQWSDAYATRVPSAPTEIVLQHKTQIIKYNFDTLTVTSYQDSSGNPVTQIIAGSQIRILGDGFNTADSTTEAVFGNAELVDMNYSTPALQIVSNGSGGYYILVTVPAGATTDSVVVNSAKGTAVGPVLTILSP